MTFELWSMMTRQTSRPNYRGSLLNETKRQKEEKVRTVSGKGLQGYFIYPWRNKKKSPLLKQIPKQCREILLRSFIVVTTGLHAATKKGDVKCLN